MTLRCQSGSFAMPGAWNFRFLNEKTRSRKVRVIRKLCHHIVMSSPKPSSVSPWISRRKTRSRSRSPVRKRSYNSDATQNPNQNNRRSSTPRTLGDQYYELIQIFKSNICPADYAPLVATTSLFKNMLTNSPVTAKNLCTSRIIEIITDKLITNNMNRFILIKNGKGSAIIVKRVNDNFTVTRAKVVDSIDNELEGETIIAEVKPVHKTQVLTNNALKHVPTGQLSASFRNHKIQSMPRVNTLLNKYVKLKVEQQ